MKPYLITGLVSLLFQLSLVLPVFGEDPGEKIIPEAIEEILQDIEKEYEPLHDVLIEVQQVNEEMYRNILEEFTRHWDDFKMLKQENAELAELEAESRAIDIKLDMLEYGYHQKQTEEEKAETAEEIRQKLEELFQLKVAKREMEIASLEAELGQLRSELEQIVQNKEEHIEWKLKQITQGDVFSW